MNSIWKSRLTDTMNRNFFRATIESVLIYSSISWTLTKKSLEKRVNGNYTRRQRAILNNSLKDHFLVDKTIKIEFCCSLLDIQIGTGIGCYNMANYSW